MRQLKFDASREGVRFATIMVNLITEATYKKSGKLPIFFRETADYQLMLGNKAEAKPVFLTPDWETSSDPGGLKMVRERDGDQERVK